MKMRHSRQTLALLRPIGCAIALALAAESASAATGTWSATSGTWNTSTTNWTGVSGTPWDSSNGSGNTANFTATSGAATVSGTVYANQITYTATSGTFAINSGVINLAGTTPTISVDPSRTLTIASTLDGSAGLAKSGSGALTLTASNSYSGVTNINGGSIYISNNNALGSTTGNTVISTGTNELKLQGGITVAEDLVHNGGTGGYLRNVSGTNAWNGNITVGVINSRIRSDAGLLTIGGNVTLSNNVVFEGVGNTTVTGTISGAGALSLGANNQGTVTFSGANSYTGQTTVSRGTLSVNTLKDFGVDSSLGKGTAGTTIQLGAGANTGTLLYTGTATSSNRTFRVGSNTAGESGGAIINSNGSGALTFGSSNFNVQSSSANVSRTLTLGGTNADANTISGAIIDNNTTALVGVTKADAGKWILGGNNTYTGATTVTAGTLLIGDTVGSTAALASGSTVSVGASGTLGGQGTIGGATTITDGILAPGASTGSLAFGGNLSLVGTPQTQIELGGTAFVLNVTEDYDRIKLTGATPTLTLAGTLNVSLINAFSLSDDQAFGIFQLNPGATRSGTFNGLATDGSLVGTFGGKNLYITYSADFGDSGVVGLTGGNDIALYTIPEPSTWALLALSLTTVMVLRRRRQR